jgi:hypothetical protein
MDGPSGTAGTGRAPPFLRGFTWRLPRGKGGPAGGPALKLPPKSGKSGPKDASLENANFPGLGNAMKCLTEKIPLTELQAMADAGFGNLVKAVVDVDKRIIVIDAEMHSDQESYLLERGSRQTDLWGINLYPEFPKEDENFIEFDSMINLRPLDDNRSRSVENAETRKKITEIVRDWVT